MAKKVTPIAYSVDDTLRMDLVDDNGFSAEGVSFVVFSSSELIKNQKCYFEIIVTENPKREVCRFIPLYIGVHAEPANGILTSDFCIGSIYYTSELRIETWEKNADSGYAKHYVVQNTYARTPINGTVIGCMADLKNNEISLYSDGKLYYTFRPRSFNMTNSDEKFYFCIFAKTLTKIAATTNYGNYPLKYKPNDAYSLTQYANRYKIHYDINGWVKFSKDNGGTEDDYYENRIGIGEEFNATHVVENNIIPMTNPHRRDVWLTYADGTDLLPYKESYEEGESTANHYSYKDSKQSAYIHPGNQNIYDGDTVYRLNYPIGNDYPIYFELECKNGFLDNDYFGIPVMVGLGQEDTSSHLEGDTVYKDKITAFGLNLWHKKYNKNVCIVNLSYKYKPNGKNEVNITKYNTWDITKTYNPLEPKQPDIIGILIDPISRSIKVYTQGMLYMEANLDDFLVIGRDDSKTQAKATEEFIASNNNTLINSYNKGFYMNKSPFTDKEKKEFVFTNPFKLSYIFIKPMYEVFDMSVDDLPMITLNLGSDIENVPFKYKIPTGAMSYWYYFNWLIRNLCHRDIECIFTALSYYINVNKSIRCTIHVSGSNKYNNPLEFSPGLNMMWGEYTNISDEEVHYNEPDIDPIEFRAIMDDRVLEKVENKVETKVFRDISGNLNLKLVKNVFSAHLIDGTVKVIKKTEYTKFFDSKLTVAVKPSTEYTKFFDSKLTVAVKPSYDLRFYYKKIANYSTITTLPEENANYIKETLPNVTDCYAMMGDAITMFDSNNGCEALTSIDTTGWDTSNIKNMGRMFNDCRSLTNLDVSKWNTSNVTNMNGMFEYCDLLTKLDLSNWDTSSVTDMSYMFWYCTALTTLDLSNWDTSNVTNMGAMFGSCESLTTLDVSNWNTSNVTNMHSMFEHCYNLTSLDVSNWDTSNVTNMSYMFLNCESLTTLDLSNWDTSNVTDMRWMFWVCDSLTTLDLSNWNTSNVTDMDSMFIACKSLTTIKGVIDLKSCTSYDSMFDNCPKLTGVKIKNPPKDFETKSKLAKDQYEIVY